jgi:hypothetical protein
MEKYSIKELKEVILVHIQEQKDLAEDKIISKKMAKHGIDTLETLYCHLDTERSQSLIKKLFSIFR